MMLHFVCGKRAGFTLIEIMIVIAIIAILTGIVVPNIVEARAEANYQACLQNCKTIGEAIGMALVRYSDKQLCEMGGKRYPAKLFDDSCTWLNGEFEEKVLIPLGYLSEVYVCPSGNDYGVSFYGDKMLESDEGWFYGWIVCCSSVWGSHYVANQEHSPSYGVGIGLMDYFGTGGI